MQSDDHSFQFLLNDLFEEGLELRVVNKSLFPDLQGLEDKYGL
jgi:hypothetical protein